MPHWIVLSALLSLLQSGCKHKDTGRTYALKTIKTSRMSKEMVDELMNARHPSSHLHIQVELPNVDDCAQEIDILMGLDHPNIVRPLELFSRRREIYFIM